MGDRPDPDALLEVRRQAKRAERGKLTIFFGSAPGVGKTYAMLESARFEREEGRDVVVGIVETHGRYDTGALLLGLWKSSPRHKSDYKGPGKVEELDLRRSRRRKALSLDGARRRSSARHPRRRAFRTHTNAPGSRHAKRWQDVEELLAAGLDVHSTLNVQHVESLNDVVAQITHIIVQETVPDVRSSKAPDDVRLIDLPIPTSSSSGFDEGKV